MPPAPGPCDFAQEQYRQDQGHWDKCLEKDGHGRHITGTGQRPEQYREVQQANQETHSYEARPLSRLLYDKEWQGQIEHDGKAQDHE